MALKHPRASSGGGEEIELAPLFGLEHTAIPRHRIGVEPLPPDVAYQIVHDELMLDGNARLNVATFVTTWMEPQVERLMAECFDKNMIDKDEYPQTAEMEKRCVNILSRALARARRGRSDRLLDDRVERGGMLGGLALKRRWQHARRAAGKPADRPNLVMGDQRPDLLGEVRQLLGRRDCASCRWRASASTSRPRRR